MAIKLEVPLWEESAATGERRNILFRPQSMKLRFEVCKWCNEAFSYVPNVIKSLPYASDGWTVLLCFQSEQDKILFKLRWL